MLKEHLNRYSWAMVSIFYVVFILLLLKPLLTLSVDPKWDAIDQFLPAFTYLSDAIREGRFPLWDPFTNSGYPFHAEPQFNTLNPFAIVISLIIENPMSGFVWFWILHWVWGGLGMIWLARHFGCSPLGALVAAMSYSLSGFFIGHGQHTPFIQVASWTPWFFYLADKAVAKSSVGFTLLAGTAIGISSYGGYPGLILFSHVALALWLCLRYLAWTPQGDTRTMSSRTLWVCTVLLVTGVILIAVWSPTLSSFFIEGRDYTDRVSRLEESTASYSNTFTLQATISFVAPYLTILAHDLMATDLSMSNAYMGLLIIPLAVFGFFNSAERKIPWWIFIYIAFMFILSLGGDFGLRKLLNIIYPPLEYTRHSSVFRLYFILPISLLAGMSFSYLYKDGKSIKILLVILLSWMALCFLALFLFFVSTGINFSEIIANYYMKFYQLILLLIVFSLIFCAYLNKWGKKVNIIIAILVIGVFIDSSMHLYNNSITVWSDVSIAKTYRSERWRSLEVLKKEHNSSTVVNGNPRNRLPGMPFNFVNAQQIMKVPIVGGYVTMQKEGFDDVLKRSRFQQVLTSEHRYWLSPGTEPSLSEETTLARLAAVGGGDPVPVFTPAGMTTLNSNSVVPGSYGVAKITKYAPERIEMVTYAPNNEPAFLASTERYSSSWKAFVNGEQSNVINTNLYFRGVLVPPGESNVIWIYNPIYWKPLLMLSYLTVFACFFSGLVLTIGTKYTNRKRSVS